MADPSGQGTPKVSVYLSDDLYQAARQRGLVLSTLTQEAVAHALADANADWIERARTRAERRSSEPSIDMATLMSAVRADFGR